MSKRVHIKFAIPVYLVFTAFIAQVSMGGGRIVVWGGQPLGDDLKTEMSSISAGFMHSLALTTGGLIKAWGNNDYGQTDIPEYLNSNFAAISAGGIHSLALTKNGQVIAWGCNGDGQSSTASIQTKDFAAVSAGTFHSLALKKSGVVVAWGNNDFGQTSVPLALDNVKAISAGAIHSLALRGKDGQVFSWGDNSYGQSTIPSSATKGIKAISAGYFHSLALTTGGRVIAWGDNSYNQCDVPSNALNDVVSISAGQTYSMALKADGTLIVWGGNDAEDPEEAGPPVNNIKFTAVSAGGHQRLGLIPAISDANSNGIPDWWEWQFGLADSAGASSDFDGDGISDFDEYLADTDPTDRSSKIHVEISMDLESETFNVSYGPLSVDRTYTLESASDLSSDQWSPITGVASKLKDSSSVNRVRTITVNNPQGYECRVFRVNISQP